MEQIRKQLHLTKGDYYETHLEIINPILPVRLTSMEIKVLAAFMSLEGDIVQYRFGSAGRKIVMKRLELTPQGISNYMTQLIKKECIIEKEDTGEITILPILLPEKKEQYYMFKIINTDLTN